MKQTYQTSLLLIVLIISGWSVALGQNKQRYTHHSPVAHHQVALEVLQASKNWIDAFNQGKATQCGRAYHHKNATMRAMPFGVKQGRVSITAFWSSLIAQGATQLEYTQVAIEVVNKNTALLSADWRMNIGEGKIYQEKWSKENGQWVLVYDDFEVLKKYPAPIVYEANAVASHEALEAVIQTSMQWVQSFNQQKAAACANLYAQNATLNGVPFTSVHRQAAILSFWAKLVKDGARNLTYHQLKAEAVTPGVIKLAAHWSMNIGEGKIYQEKWVKEQGKWRLGYDEFEVLKQY
ncbi:hypothetical protein [Microscilla marina]|uniref:Uncharacterized protein n=1 Tax=Microscilla marina ATCC 23134 TaxID=313606 RepID=A1ZQE4_MICM2|nr:hypothetical protein [Microscilla marina]EAY27316.1 hypothetical protein M23134_08268 [Microscilla marina ATCC 23134]